MNEDFKVRVTAPPSIKNELMLTSFARNVARMMLASDGWLADYERETGKSPYIDGTSCLNKRLKESKNERRK